MNLALKSFEIILSKFKDPKTCFFDVVSSLKITEASELLFIAAHLAKSGIISHNAKALMKNMIVRNDVQVLSILNSFRHKDLVLFLRDLHGMLDQQGFQIIINLYSNTLKNENERNCLRNVLEVEFKSIAQESAEFEL
mmetsp:Transcript_12255/g.17286  ORF Transcript_12255/g.17286 Transcript_12255/m.17286 type:complete len:138 (+) Transcript_12255:109-522(+)